MDRVPSTQDVAREELGDAPVLVIASGQTEGRGRSGSDWLTAERALAVSLAFRGSSSDNRPFSLMAGVAAALTHPGTQLKWPNDVMWGEGKVGGILVERSGEVTVVGMGLNLWWPAPAAGAAALYSEDPGPSRHLEIGALWGAEMMELVDAPGWPRDVYLDLCATLGQEVTWEPRGRGRAIAVTEDGALLVDTPAGEEKLYSGAVWHVRGS